MGLRKLLVYEGQSGLGLFLLRVGVGLLMGFGHGLPKLANFSELSQRFPDPIGVGATFSLVLAIFAEFFCSLALVIGLSTRLASLFLGFTMAVAFFIVHASDPFGKKELALVYLLCYIVIFIAGPGNHSLDAKLRRV